MHASIRLVVFDMDDVLCRYDRPQRVALLAALAGRRPDDVHAAIWDSGFEDLSDAGALDAPSYLAGFGARIGYPLTLAEWIDARRASMTPDAAMLALAAEVKRKVDVALLTNNGLLTRQTIGEIFPELPPLFAERLFCSAQFGAAKPDARVFGRLCQRVGIPPYAALMIDDQEENVAGAQAAGWDGHWFRGVEGVRRKLGELGVVASSEPRTPLPLSP
jgi:glucose-1-phosphatase